MNLNFGLACCVTQPSLGTNAKLRGEVRKVSAIRGEIRRVEVERIYAKSKKVDRYAKGELSFIVRAFLCQAEGGKKRKTAHAGGNSQEVTSVWKMNIKTHQR